MEITSTKYQYKLDNGETVNMTLSFAGLYRLRAENKDAYDRYKAIMSKNAKDNDELDMAMVLYTAYLCANIGAETMSEYDFICALGSDRQKVGAAMQELILPKKA